MLTKEYISAVIYLFYEDCAMVAWHELRAGNMTPFFNKLDFITHGWPLVLGYIMRKILRIRQQETLIN